MNVRTVIALDAPLPRYLVAVIAGMLATLAVFLLMHRLIGTGSIAVETETLFAARGNLPATSRAAGTRTPTGSACTGTDIGCSGGRTCDGTAKCQYASG